MSHRRSLAVVAADSSNPAAYAAVPNAVTNAHQSAVCNATTPASAYAPHHLLPQVASSSFRATAEYSSSSAFIQLASAASTSASTSAAQMLSAHQHQHQQQQAHQHNQHHHQHNHNQSPMHHHHQRLSAAAAVSAMDQFVAAAAAATATATATATASSTASSNLITAPSSTLTELELDDELLVDAVDEDEPPMWLLHLAQLTEQFAAHRNIAGSAVEALNGYLKRASGAAGFTNGFMAARSGRYLPKVITD
ncbi:histone-lysine N-methyltransferase Suv4-20-like [Bactrocera neohumeralis]|uniref:histone-lysine N-methyltransferase Suv4-20-like n=1 Tax=Bactrocera neohumeralis TaxID=98809 RepID=UPI002165AFDA|nr:histone-lysine N-methyltransferase Suv4-20-like [Bactrocera neohumeralis]